MKKRFLPFDANTLHEGVKRSARTASDMAAHAQAVLERGRMLKLLRFTGDIAVAVGALALQHGRAQDGGLSLLQMARGGLLSGAATSVALAAFLNLHKTARGEQTLRQSLHATTREAFSGAGSGMAATLAASCSKAALGAVGAPVLAKAAAPVVAAAVAGWLAQEAAEHGMRKAEAWLFVPPHAMPDYPPQQAE